MDGLPRVPLRLLPGAAVRVDKDRDPELWHGDPRPRLRRASACRSAAAGWSPTATSPPASPSCASSCTASAGSRPSSAAAPRVLVPDAFGYAGQLPQILRRGGITRFLTQKLSWNRFNRPEHHTLTWQGDDGSEVLAHFPPADTYNGEARASASCSRSPREYRDHDHGRREPARLRLRRRRRRPDAEHARDPAAEPPTCRACRAPRSARAEEFFGALEAGGEDRPVLVGELYFEYHRGVYTSPGAHEARQPARRAGAARRRVHRPAWAAAYPRAELDRLWKLLLLQQFHDILPGFGDRARVRGRRARSRGRRGGRQCATSLGAGGPRSSTRSGFARREVVGDRHGRGGAVRRRARSSSPATRSPSTGLTLRERAPARRACRPAAPSSRCCTRPAVARRWPRRQPPRAHDDRPVAFDAWDIDPSALETRRDSRRPTSWHAHATPLRAEITFERQPAAHRRSSGSTPARAGSSSTRRSTGTRSTRC